MTYRHAVVACAQVRPVEPIRVHGRLMPASDHRQEGAFGQHRSIRANARTVRMSTSKCAMEWRRSIRCSHFDIRADPPQDFRSHFPFPA